MVNVHSEREGERERVNVHCEDAMKKWNNLNSLSLSVSHTLWHWFTDSAARFASVQHIEHCISWPKRLPQTGDLLPRYLQGLMLQLAITFIDTRVHLDDSVIYPVCLPHRWNSEGTSPSTPMSMSMSSSSTYTRTSTWSLRLGPLCVLCWALKCANVKVSVCLLHFAGFLPSSWMWNKFIVTQSIEHQMPNEHQSTHTLCPSSFLSVSFCALCQVKCKWLAGWKGGREERMHERTSRRDIEDKSRGGESRHGRMKQLTACNLKRI